MDAMTILSNGTMKAFALIAQRNGEGDSINIERAIDAMKGVLKSHLDDILNQTAVRDMAVAMIQSEKQALDDERENLEAQLRQVREDQVKMAAAFSEYLELQRQNTLLRNDLDAAQ